MAPSVIRQDLVVPYIHVKPKADAASSNVVSQSMPMAAMFMKNKLLSWFALFSAFQAYFGELHGEPAAEGSQSALLRLGLGILGIGVCYMELFLPGSSGAVPKPKGSVEKVAEGISATIATAAAAVTSSTK